VESFKYNETSCKGFEYVGEYIGSDGSTKTIDEAGRVSYEIYYPSGYVARGTHTTYIQSWNESSIMLWYIYQNAKDEREIRTIELKKENEIWSFVYDGITYSKTDASQSE
ncbi:MAG: hypothetical protein K2J85_01310, partial [Anaeroplasmataceae bacterium]|nr:hypothetical protein [Anaeroplasmataceae bacterium]